MAKRTNSKKIAEIKDYDENDSSGMVDPAKRLKLEDIGIKLSPESLIQIESPNSK